MNHFEFHAHLSEKSKLFKNLCNYALKLRENPFDYTPLTYYIEVDITNQKSYAKMIHPFVNAFYALEDNKKKAARYFQRLEEVQNDRVALDDLGSARLQDDPYDE